MFILRSIHQALIAPLHVLTRILTPLVPLSLGAALNAFLSSVPVLIPLGSSPYTYIFAFALLQFLVSDSGIPNFTKALVSRLGAGADDALSSHYADHVLGPSLGYDVDSGSIHLNGAPIHLNGVPIQSLSLGLTALLSLLSLTSLLRGARRLSRVHWERVRKLSSLKVC